MGVGQHPDPVAVDVAPPRHQRRPVHRLVLGEARPVDDAGQDLPGVERHLEVHRHDPEQLLGIVHRLLDGPVGAPAELAEPEVGHDLAPDADAVDLVVGHVVGQARHPGVHLRPAEGLVVGVFPGSHLHQRRPAEEHLGLLVDQHRVVAHARHVGAAGGRVPEHQGDRGDPEARQLRQVVEQAPGGEEQLRLARQVTPGRLHQVDHRQAVLPGDLHRPLDLLPGVGVRGPGPHRGVVGDDHALRPRHHADAGDQARPDVELRPVGGHGGELQERRVLVEEQVDPLVGQEAAPAVVPIDGLRPPAAPGQSLLLGQGRQQPVEGGGVLLERRAGGVDPRGQNGASHGGHRTRSRP